MENQLFSGRADLHMHTVASDGTATAQQILDHVARRGDLNVIAITDHDCLDESLWAYSQRDRYPFDVIPGVEVTSYEGHILGLWVTQPIPMGMSIAETTAAVHQQGGIAILAHPFELFLLERAFWRHLRHPEVLLEAGIDAIEVFNAGTVTPGNSHLARRMCRRLNLAAVANSDAHLMSSIGRGVTRFNGSTAVDLRDALAAGLTIAEGTSWPVTDYLKLSRSSIQKRLNGSSVTSIPLARPTHIQS